MLTPFNTNPPERNEPVIPSRALWWFRCSAQVTTYDGQLQKDVCKANLWDGTNQGKTDYIVKTFSLRNVNDTFYATRPEGGTDTNYTDPQGNTYKVVWMETPVGVAVQYAKVKIDWKTYGNTYGPKFIEAFDCSVTGDLATLPPGTAEADRPVIVLRVSCNMTKGTWYANLFKDDIVQYIPTQNDTTGTKAVAGTLFWAGITGGELRSLFQVTGDNALGFDRLRSHNLP